MGDGVWAGGSSTGETLETHRHAALSSSEKGEGKCVRVTRREQQERGRERVESETRGDRRKKEKQKGEKELGRETGRREKKQEA